MYGSTVKELDAKIKSAINELDYGVNNKELFGNFLRDWLFDVHCMDIKPSTKERYEGIYRNYVKNSDISGIKLKDITSKDIQDYYNKLIKKSKSVNCIKNLHKLIAPAIRYAYDSNMIIKDFSRAIVVPKDTEEKKLSKINDVKPFNLSEQEKFIEAIRGHDLELLFLTALNSGLRQGELLALTWNDIDFENDIIRVNKTVKYTIDVSKNGRENFHIALQTPKSENSNRSVTIPNFLTKRL